LYFCPCIKKIFFCLSFILTLLSAVYCYTREVLSVHHLQNSSTETFFVSDDHSQENPIFKTDLIEDDNDDVDISLRDLFLDLNTAQSYSLLSNAFADPLFKRTWSDAHFFYPSSSLFLFIKVFRL